MGESERGKREGGTGIFRNLNCYENWHLLCPFLPKYKNWIKNEKGTSLNGVPLRALPKIGDVLVIYLVMKNKTP